jgi:hypothetical protein
MDWQSHLHLERRGSPGRLVQLKGKALALAASCIIKWTPHMLQRMHWHRLPVERASVRPWASAHDHIHKITTV